jgi:hypothetical protein
MEQLQTPERDEDLCNSRSTRMGVDYGLLQTPARDDSPCRAIMCWCGKGCSDPLQTPIRDKSPCILSVLSVRPVETFR